jgi:hypothetical protein
LQNTLLVGTGTGVFELMKAFRHLARLALFGSGAFLLSGPEASAQDGHYWTEFYGTRSTILNGVVIGSVDDLAAVYYNPARLAVMDNPGVILSGKVYEWSLLEIEDALGEGFDLSESAFGGVPSMAAGTFRIPFWPKHQFGYAFLTRYRFGADIFVRDSRRAEVVEAFPGIESFDEKLFWNTEVKEEWFGLSWSYPVNERVSVGFTGFYADRGKKVGSDLRLTALSEDGRVAQWIRNRAVGYSASGFLGKFGIAADLHPVSLGLTVTTPKLNVGGKGHLVYEDILNGLDQDQDGLDDDRFEASLQKDLPAKHRWPWSVGAGAGMTMGKHMLHLSAEWFGPVSRYTLMEAEDFVGQTTGDTISHRIFDDLKSILNFGMGYEYFFSDRFSAHLSVATDYSAVRRDEGPSSDRVHELNNSTFQKNFFHYGGGASLTFSAVEFTLGATYTTAAQEIDRPLDFLDEGGGPSPYSETTATLRANRIRFLFGFELFFLEGLRERAGAG